MDFNRYFTNQELAQLLAGWAESYAGVMALSGLGKSQEGRPIHLVTIANTWQPRHRQTRHLAGCQSPRDGDRRHDTALRIAELLSKYGEDARITPPGRHDDFLHRAARQSDGADLAMRTAQMDSFRHPALPVRGPADGLYSKDIDGDGHLLRCGSKTPMGLVSTVNPVLMEACSRRA
jgi:hypothetical protein